MGGEQSPLGAYEWDFTRVILAQHFQGWTFPYIDSLSQREVGRIFAVLNAQGKLRAEEREKRRK